MHEQQIAEATSGRESSDVVIERSPRSLVQVQGR